MFRRGAKRVRAAGVGADGDEVGRREVAIAREVINLNISTRASSVDMCGNSYTDVMAHGAEQHADGRKGRNRPAKCKLHTG